MMRNIYLFVLIASLSVSINAQKVLMLIHEDSLYNNGKQVYEGLLSAGLKVDTVSILEAGTKTLTDYNLVLISEAATSDNVDANFTAYAEIPTVSLKSYSLRKTNIVWLEDGISFRAADDQLELEANATPEIIAENTEIEILQDHAIFTNIGAKGDTFSFAVDNFNSDLVFGHFQAMDFTKALVDDIKNNAIELGSSTKAQALGWDFTTVLAAIDSNTTTKRCVVFGIHSQYLLSEMGLRVITNSAYWAMGLEPPVSVEKVPASQKFNIFPNPMNDQLNLNQATAINLVEVIDITGKVVASVANEGAYSIQINTSKLNTGIYMIRVSTFDGIYTDKLIK